MTRWSGRWCGEVKLFVDGCGGKKQRGNWSKALCRTGNDVWGMRRSGGERQWGTGTQSKAARQPWRKMPWEQHGGQGACLRTVLRFMAITIYFVEVFAHSAVRIQPPADNRCARKLFFRLCRSLSMCTFVFQSVLVVYVANPAVAWKMHCCVLMFVCWFSLWIFATICVLLLKCERVV